MTRKSFFRSLAVLAVSPAIVVRALKAAIKSSTPVIRSGFSQVHFDPALYHGELKWECVSDNYEIEPTDEMVKTIGRYPENLPQSKFTREQIVAMIDRGEDVESATDGYWTFLRGFPPAT